VRQLEHLKEITGMFRSASELIGSKSIFIKRQDMIAQERRIHLCLHCIAINKIDSHFDSKADNFKSQILTDNGSCKSYQRRQKIVLMILILAKIFL